MNDFLFLKESHGVWFVEPPSGGRFGPADGSLLRKWLAEGRICDESRLWFGGSSDSQQVSAVFGKVQTKPEGKKPEQARQVDRPKPNSESARRRRTTELRPRFQRTGPEHRPAMPMSMVAGDSLVGRTLGWLWYSAGELQRRKARLRPRERWQWWWGVVMSAVVLWCLVVVAACLYVDQPESSEPITLVSSRWEPNEIITASLDASYEDAIGGVLITAVEHGGAAYHAGLRKNDLITGFSMDPLARFYDDIAYQVPCVKDLDYATRRSVPGDTMLIRYKRERINNRARVEFGIELLDLEITEVPINYDVVNTSELQSIVSQEVPAYIGVHFEDTPNGVKVLLAESNTVGFTVGDVLIEINGTSIRTERECRLWIDIYQKKLYPEKPLQLQFRRDDREFSVRAQLNLNYFVMVDVDSEAPAAQIELSQIGETTAPRNDLMATVGANTGSGLKDRGSAARGQKVAKLGGNPASEAAVAKALKWLADHQAVDGGWSFDHRKAGVCNDRCTFPGDATDCRTGATALALLSFLGAGHSHKEGDFRRNVEAGLYYLVSQMKVQSAERRGNLGQGAKPQYSHGLATMALCEAYAMTADKGLAAPAQLALNHIVHAQDTVGGGWRYSSRQAGDTSVTGWQLLALKSGHLGYLLVPKESILGTNKFLDSVQTDQGSRYGYVDHGAGKTTTAIGLLCRMHLGWKKDHPGVEKGVQYLSSFGPSETDFYYDFFASQVLFHYGGEPWEKWNPKLRDFLVRTQSSSGHEAGSWYVIGDQGSGPGGRLYCTALATLILEGYYRNERIYQVEAAEDEFPLK